jgi:CheY-like chemotaxis protein
MPKQPLLNSSEVARLLGVTPATIRNWSNSGDLVSHPTGGGHRRYTYQEIKNYARKKGMTLFQDSDHRLKILVVEDDPQFSAFIVEALETLDAETAIQCATDGFDAGRLVHSFQPHLVLLDLMLPGIDGFKICQQLREDPETSAVRVIAMTGYDSPENVSRILSAGAETCLAKPFSVDMLINAIGVSDESKWLPSV